MQYSRIFVALFVALELLSTGHVTAVDVTVSVSDSVVNTVLKEYLSVNIDLSGDYLSTSSSPLTGYPTVNRGFFWRKLNNTPLVYLADQVTRVPLLLPHTCHSSIQDTQRVFSAW